MNILILSGRFGMGHIKAAAAIEESIKARDGNACVYTVDLTAYLFPHLSYSVYGGFRLLVAHCARLYNTLNKAAEQTGATPLKKASCRKLRNLLTETNADIVISVLPLCTQYFAAYKETSGCKIPLYTYVTDIAVHKEWCAAGCNRYFVGADCTKESLISQGVPAEDITVSGIPVLSDFGGASNKHRETPHREAAKKQILLMGGGYGLMPLHDKVLRLMHARRDWEVTVITGKNRRLKQRMRERFPRFRTLGFVDNACEYMRRADLLITKPGGVSTFEAIAARLPIFVVEPVLEQETGNAQFIEAAGIGKVFWKCGNAKKPLSEADADEIIRCIADMLSEFPGPRQERQCMEKLSQSFESFCPLDYYEEGARDGTALWNG